MVSGLRGRHEHGAAGIQDRERRRYKAGSGGDEELWLQYLNATDLYGVAEPIEGLTEGSVICYIPGALCREPGLRDVPAKIFNQSAVICR